MKQKAKTVIAAIDRRSKNVKEREVKISEEKTTDIVTYMKNNQIEQYRTKIEGPELTIEQDNVMKEMGGALGENAIRMIVFERENKKLKKCKVN